MSNNGDFSPEDSEELIANLKSGKPSQFEQLRSTLNLLAHVTELPPTSIPSVLPSEISQPIPLIPVKSIKPRRTIVTSVVVAGMLASVSLAAAAVTGIGPTPIVNIGHGTVKFVKGVAGAVSNVVTGGNADTAVTDPMVPAVPGLTPAPTGDEDSFSDDDNESDSFTIAIPPLPIPLAPEAKKSHESKDDNNQGKAHENNSSDDGDSTSPTASIPPMPSIKTEKEHAESDGSKTPEPSKRPKLPTALPSPDTDDDASDDD